MAEPKQETAASKAPLLLDSIDPVFVQKATQESPQHQKSNTMEAQQQPADPKVPRSTPQLVGLTTFKYSPQSLPQTEPRSAPAQNLLKDESIMQYFYQQKPKSKRVLAMRKAASTLAESVDLLSVKIQLPRQFLIEQINLKVSSSDKFESEFSKRFKLLAASSQHGPVAVRSAFSETVARNGTLEYNVVAVGDWLQLTFARDTTPIDHDQIELKVTNQEADLQLEDKYLSMVERGEGIQNIINDDDDDLRILDSLPPAISNKTKPQTEVDPLFNSLLTQIEVVGFDLQTIPAITNLTYFMNQQFYLIGLNKRAEANALDFSIGQLLVTTKRATQAAEVYRKIQARLLAKPDEHAFTECAVLELLVADSLSVEQQLNDKLQSFIRMTQFLRKIVPHERDFRFSPQIRVTEQDAFSAMLRVLPDCLRFAIVCLTHRYEIVRISALKLLRYMLEVQGCSLDFGLVFVLKGMLLTYPDQTAQSQDFNLKQLLGSDITITEYLFGTKPAKAQPTTPTAASSIDEPTSGFKRALANTYQNVLDTFISVLSSVSSHILHGIFYEVIEPVLLDTQNNAEVKVFACKIAEKIITICQGDLLISSALADRLLQLVCNQKNQLPDSPELAANTQLKNLWTSVRQKVFPNYSTRGFRQLVGWLVQRLTEWQGAQEKDEQVRQMAEIITIVAMGRQKCEEDANQLIRLPTAEKYGGGPSTELYLVLTPLIFWLEFAIDREDRLPLFQQVYQTIKDVLEGLPPGQCHLDMPTVILPSLQRCNIFLAHNSAPLGMLKFLDITLADIQRHFSHKGQKPAPPHDLQCFFAELLGNFVQSLSYSLYEESFHVFDKLVSLCSEQLSDSILKRCIVALVDKYTMKSKQHKATMQQFMKLLLDVAPSSRKSPKHRSTELNLDALSEGPDFSLPRANYFEVMSEFCFFANIDETQPADLPQLHFRQPGDLHELFSDKLQFFIDSLGLMSEHHIALFTNLITHPHFKPCLLSLLQHGETAVRLRSHEVLEALTNYFVQYCPSKTVYEFSTGNSNQNEMMDAEFISHERLYISQIVIAVAKTSLERADDCYLQFNALIALDFLFQNLLPVPTFQNELLKAKRQKEAPTDDPAMDVELLSISESTPELDVLDPVYLKMRIRLVDSLWPYIQQALNSPWSNIRSICYGLICSMIKIDVNDYPQTTNLSFDSKHSEERVSQHSLREMIIPMLYSLLSSKESESKAGGLNILGSFCGLSYDFTSVHVHKHLAFFQRNSQFIGLPVWKLVYELQDDWDITIKEASVVLVQLCAPRACILYFQSRKESQERQRIEYMFKSMPSVNQIYDYNDSVTITCGVRSEYAQKAIALFPGQKDCEQVLSDEPLEHPETASFHAFMMDKGCKFPSPMPALGGIDADNTMLSQMVHEFNPTYEDKRLTKGFQPMSRRRQMEIELNMAPKNTEEPDPNFFVDTYTDDQIQEIISIFRNDFKPPKNLWIEKQPNSVGGQTSQSPDCYGDIYSEAIEQFNQHQMLMQQKQQDELQQQVSSGSSLNTSVSSQITAEEVAREESDTPSPEIKVEQKRTTPEISTEKLSVPIGPVGPTSPVLVSQTVELKKRDCSIEKINLENVKVDKPQPEVQKLPLRLAENDFYKESEAAMPHTTKVESKSDKLVAVQSNSTPDFNLSPGKSKTISGDGSEEQRISRKMAQTYLSGLSQGYLAKNDNLKLLNNCLNNDLNKTKKLSIKTGVVVDQQLTGSLTYGSTKSQKKSTLSNSPKTRRPKQVKPRVESKQVNGLADLNYFIKTIEKDFGSLPTTPSSLIKKVGDQMKALGVDPKIWKQVEQQELRKAKHPQVKALALNQVLRDDSTTNSLLKQTGSPTRSSAPSTEQFCKTQRMDKKNTSLVFTSVGGKLHTHREDHRGRGDSDIDKLSSARGVSSGSAGNRSHGYPVQPQIMTERSGSGQMPLSAKSRGNGGFLQFKKGSSKSQQKGYSALATKSLLSPQLKRDQQSGGLVQNKLNNSAGNIGGKKKGGSQARVSWTGKEKGGKSVIYELVNQQQHNNNGGGKARMPASTRNLEQGDRKTLSPDSHGALVGGKPPRGRKKAGHSHTSSSSVAHKPSLQLQHPSSYY